jgi:hypothetical protein
MPNNYRVVGFEKLTVSDSALALASVPSTAKCFVGVLEDAAVRMRGDGTDPDGSTGVLVGAGEVVVLSESEFANAKFIRDTATDGVLQGNYYNIEAGLFAPAIYQ